MGDFYAEYIVSEAWRIKCREALERAAYKCQLCAKDKKLSVHHNTYDRLGKELPQDLVVLCQKCHNVYHAKRDGGTKHKYRNEAWIKKLQKKHYHASPSPPRENRLQRPQKVFKPTKHATGKMITVTVTPEYRDSLCYSSMNVTTYLGLKLLGEPAPFQGRWRKNCLNRVLQVDEGELKAMQAYAAEQRVIYDVNPYADPLSDGDVQAIRREYASSVYMGVRTLAKKWKRTTGEIKKALGVLVKNRRLHRR